MPGRASNEILDIARTSAAHHAEKSRRLRSVLIPKARRPEACCIRENPEPTARLDSTLGRRPCTVARQTKVFPVPRARPQNQDRSPRPSAELFLPAALSRVGEELTRG